MADWGGFFAWRLLSRSFTGWGDFAVFASRRHRTPSIQPSRSAVERSKSVSGGAKYSVSAPRSAMSAIQRATANASCSSLVHSARL